MMKEICEGLLPPILIKGEPTPAMPLSERLEHYNVPGISVAVIDNGEIEGILCQGVRRAQSDFQINPDTRFQAASISKPIVAMAALRLVQDGKLKLDQDVNEALQGWKLPESVLTLTEKVTLRRLLSHTAGLSVHGYEGYPVGAPLPTLEEILNGDPPANSAPIHVELVPGSRYQYSGGGFVLVQQLLMDITAMTFPDLMEELIFNPLGLENSGFLQPLPVEAATQAAVGHNTLGEPIHGGWHVYPELAAAGLWSTPTDLAIFLIEVIQSMNDRSNLILSHEMAQVMVRVQGDDGTWGFGMGFLRMGDGQSLHLLGGGSNWGYRSKMVVFPKTRQGAVVMTNAEGGEWLNDEVLRGIAERYHWPSLRPLEKTVTMVDPTILEQYRGDYILDEYPDFPIRISVGDNKLILSTAADGERRELHPESDSKFFTTISTREYSFIRDEGDRVIALETSGGGGQTIIVKKFA
jgi:CubicO group peptidase (beta-lactamase class C family)